MTDRSYPSKTVALQEYLEKASKVAALAKATAHERLRLQEAKDEVDLMQRAVIDAQAEEDAARKEFDALEPDQENVAVVLDLLKK